MKSVFHRFLFGSIVVLFMIGGVQGDRSANMLIPPVEQTEEVEVNYWAALHSTVSEASKKDRDQKAEKKDAFSFKFPNIFDVFRSLF